MLLSAPDSLVVSITKNHVDSDEEASTAGVVLSTPPQSHVNSFGINGLDMLKFTYKVILQLIYCAFLTEFLFKNMSFLTKNYKWILEIWNWQVPWPLELIANTEAIKKYNQVSGLLLGFFLFLPWHFNSFHHSDYDGCSCYLVGSFYQLYSTFNLNKYIFR